MIKYIATILLITPTILTAHRNWNESHPSNNNFFGLERGHMWGGNIAMWIAWIIILALLGFILYKVFTLKNVSKGDYESSLDIARKRYARGEITKDEFELLKKDLQS